jgi:acetyltransferase-like isoleucine patch superfamily enzyme
MDALHKQLRRLLVHLVNLVQRHLLGDDAVSIALRLWLLRLLGVKMGARCKILGGSQFLGGKLTMGDDVFINRECYFDFSDHITLEDGAQIGHGVTFITAHHAIGTPEKRSGEIFPKPIMVRKGVWIGANVTLLPNVTIGNGAVIAACACVTKDVAANNVAAGIPARMIREL